MKKVTFERNDIASRDDSSAIVRDGLLADLRQLIDSAKSQVVQTPIMCWWHCTGMLEINALAMVRRLFPH